MKLKLMTIILSAVFLSGCAQVMPFKAPTERFFVANTTSDDIAFAIEEAASKLTWKIESRTPNRAILSWPDKPSRYKVTIQLVWTNTSLAATFVSAEGLKKTDGCSDPDGVGGNVTPYYRGLCLNKKICRQFDRLLGEISAGANLAARNRL